MNITSGPKTRPAAITREHKSPDAGRDASPSLERGLCVWWTSQSDVEGTRALLSTAMIQLPKYLETQLKSRDGRPGRGRLWVACGIDLKGGIPWDTSKPSSVVIHNGNCGGIVVRETDLALVKGLPGLVTDVRLNRV